MAGLSPNSCRKAFPICVFFNFPFVTSTARWSYQSWSRWSWVQIFQTGIPVPLIKILYSSYSTPNTFQIVWYVVKRFLTFLLIFLTRLLLHRSSQRRTVSQKGPVRSYTWTEHTCVLQTDNTTPVSAGLWHMETPLKTQYKTKEALFDDREIRNL